MPTEPSPDTMPAAVARPARLHQLDSLRGIAAITVLIGHLMINFKAVWDTQNPDRLWLMRDTPLHGLWSGNAAVLFFFVLSGFVLSLPFHARHVPYGPFVVRRIFRIYATLFVGLAIGFTVRALTYKGVIPALSDGFNRMWLGTVGAKEILQHVLLLPSFKTYQIIPPVWSLVHEMRMSLAFPLIMLLARIRPVSKALAVSAAIAMLGVALTIAMKRIGWQQDYTMTLYYVPEFVVGAIMAGHRKQIINRLQRITSAQRALLFMAGVLMYTWRWWFFPRLDLFHRITVFDDALIIAGAATMMAVSLASRRLTAFLGWRPVLAVGLASYSFYLIHQTFVLGALHWLYGRTATWIPLSIAVGASAVATWAVYRWVEVPSIAAGRRVSDWMLRRATEAGKGVAR